MRRGVLLPVALLPLFVACGAPPDDRPPPGATSEDGDPVPTTEDGEPPPPPTPVAVRHEPDGAVGLARRFSIEADTDEPLRLTCATPDDPGERHVLDREGPGELRLYGLLAEHRWTCDLRDRWDRPLWAGSFETGALPPDLPTLLRSGDPARAEVDEGYLLFSHWRIGVGDRVFRLVIADPEGRIRWWLHLPEARAGGIEARWLGDAMVIGGGGVTPSIRDLSGEARFSVGPPTHPDPEDDVYHHEAALTPAGLLSLERVPDSEGAVAWQGFLIRVTDPRDGAETWSFDSRDARRLGLLPPGTPDEDDPYHANAVTWRDDDPEGPSVWVSLKAMQQILRIDRTTGALSYVGHLGPHALVDPGGAPLGEDEWFWGQHAPEIVGRSLLVYDNGNHRPAGERRSRVVAYSLDGPDRATRLWSWTEPRWFEPNFGSAQSLSRGTVLVATGHSPDAPGTGGENDHGWFAEIDPAAGDVVWRLDFGSWSDTTYRARFVPGCELFANRRYCPAGAP